jgi:hypothetical protein
MTHDEADALAEAAVKRTFLTLGIDISDPEAVIKVQSDFKHLRMWRESTEAVKRKALLTAVGVIVAGALGYLLLTFRGHP